VDLVLASPECTSHTCARGNRARLEESRETALHVLNFVRAFRPRWVVIENVIHMRAWARYEEFISALREHFNIREFVLDAALFGVPQSRKRLFIVGDRDCDVPDVAGTGPGEAAFSVIDQKNGWRMSPLFSPGRAEPTLARAMRAVGALGEGVPFLIVYYGTDGAGGWQPLDRPLRTLTTLDRFALVEWESGAPVMRMLQVPELKRAMGFGDEYRLLHGTRRDRIKLLGNAVCPPVVQAIVERLIESDRPGDVDKLPLLDKGAVLLDKRSPS
jgi:DNA (cytosine-5)-methyltransferase 1